MLMDPLPNICKVYSLLVQQERQIIAPIDDSKLLAFLNNQYQGEEILLFVARTIKEVDPQMVEVEAQRFALTLE